MNKTIQSVLVNACLAALVGLGVHSAFAASSRTTVKTVTWTLPSDWEGTLELDQICEPVGAPSMPYYNALIEVPSTATNFAITASGVAYRASDKDRPTPVLEPSVVGEAANAPVEDAALYAGIYPSDVFEQGEPWEMNGKTYLPVRVKVYRWNGPTAKVEALASLTLSIACASPRTGLKMSTASVPSTKVDYIVISPHNYVSYWQKFIDYRKTTHTNMTFEIVDANDIYNTYKGADHQLQIHHFIEAMYKLGTKYILLGAGAPHSGYNSNTMIPIRSCVTYNGNTQSCDFYYCVMDYKGGKEVWDYNGDGIYLASKNSSGGYTTDSTSQFTWQGAIMVHRFPARDTVTLGGKSKTAKEQIEGYVEKLRRAEQGLFDGRFSQAILGHQRSAGSDTAHGNTSSDVTMERQFYDLGANIFSEAHGTAIAGIELDTRARAYNYMTVHRPVGYNRSVLQFYYKNNETASDFYGRNFDAMLINAHGSPETVEPIEYAGVFKSTGLSVFHIMCCPCHAGNPCSGGNAEVSIAEAGVVNPDGGSLVTFANSASGWYGGRDVMSQKIEVNLVRSLYGHLSGMGFQNAGEARLYAQNNYGYSPSPRNANGQCLANGMAYGDPLVSLSPIWSRKVDCNGNWRRGDQETISEQEFASGLTIEAGDNDNEMTITNAIGAATMTVNGAAGKTLTLKGDANGKFKVSNKVTVNNGLTLNWDVPGGFGRNGINFSAGGNLRLRAEGYYGIEFQGMNGIWIAPPANKTAIVDFDYKSYFRNEKCGNIKVEGPGETIFRSRQAGIFSTTYAIPVTGGTLTLETPCVGGSGEQTSSVPLFAVTNATLAVRPNPNWSAECFSRRVTFENATLDSRYDKFYLGANVSGYPGLDISVGGTNNVFTGTSPIRLNGTLRIHTATGGVLNVTGEFVNGSGVGAIAIDEGVTLKLAAVNTFSGGVTVPSGARLVVDNVRGLGTGNIVVQSGGVLQLNAMPMAGVSSVTLQSGAKLVLKSSGSGGSYQMYSPATTSFTMADGVKVYDASNENTPLDGLVTPEGAYFISDAAKAWRGQPLTWSSTSTALAWELKGTPTTYADGDTVLFKDVSGVGSTTVYVSGEVKPGMVAFQNSATDYVFDGADASITVGSMATTGKTTFEPSIKATSQLSVGGKTTLGDVTTPMLNVAGGGKLNVSGTVSGIDTIRVIKLYITDTVGPHNATPREHAPEFSDLQFWRGDDLVMFPVGTVIEDSAKNSTTVTAVNNKTYTFNNSNTLTKLFDGDTGTYHMIGSNINGPWYITITMPESSPVEMFTKFRYGRAQSRTSSTYFFLGGFADANPRNWTLSCGDSISSLKQFASVSGNTDGTASSFTTFYTSSSWTSSSKTTVQNGGTLYLNGTYNVPVTVNAGATLAITNTSKVTFGGTKTWPSGTYSMTVDATQAKKTNGWFQVTQKAGLSSSATWLFQTDDETAVDVRSGELWVATAGVMAPPYSRTLSASGSWDTTDWMNGKNASFEKAWGDSITKSTGSATLNVTGTNLTMSVDCAVALDTLTITTPTNCFPQTLTVTADGGAANISAIDLRTFNGFVDWQPTLASWGCNVYVGTNSVKITGMTSGKGALQVGEGGHATVPQKFASYDVDMSSYLRFTGTHSFSVDSDLPAKGIQSFDDTTFVGGFQKSAVTYLVEEGDTLVFTGTSDNYCGRMSSSFDIRGGSVTINSNGASTWFGINGETTYNQTGGVFRCTASDTSMSANNSGFLVGYSASKTEDFEFNISGGRFELPNTYINFYGPVSFNLSTSGVVQAKGVYRGSNKGTITVNEGAVFEIGSIGLIDGACDFNLYGGTLAGFENGARTRSSFNLVGLGTLAAKSNTTFAVDGGINADSATLNFGKAGYTGTVKLETIPEGVTNITVTAGTWDMGRGRPGASAPTNAVLSKLDGYIAIELSDEELRTAATGGFKVMRAPTLSTGMVREHLKVVTSSGTEVPATGSVDGQGNLILGVSYVYPLYATIPSTPTPATYTFSDIEWHDAIGMPFQGEWSDVTSAELTNTLSDVTVIVTNAFTTRLAVMNTGALTVTGISDIKTLWDTSSTGATTVDLAVNGFLYAGANTIIKKGGTGTLDLGGKYCATLCDLDWTGTVNGFTGTAIIRYAGDKTLTSLNYTSSGGGTVAYAQKVDMSSGHLQFNNSLTRCFEEGLDLKVYRMSNGNQSGSPVETFYQTGGRIEALSAEDMVANPTGASPLLFAHWPGTVTYCLTGGSLIATNGINGSVYFGRDGVPKLYIGGGETKAVLRTNGLINDSRTAKDKAGSVIELKPNGSLEIGNKNFVLYRNAELRMSGGTFLAYENAEILSATSKFTLTDCTTSYLAATNGATLTVSKVPTGSGALVCNPAAGSKVVLKGGDYSNIKLGGTFTIYLREGQESAVVDTVLFTPASEDIDLKAITVCRSDGTAVEGVVRLYNGKVTFVPSTGYAMPAKATIVGDTNLWNVVWHDSSTPAKEVTVKNIAVCSDVWLEVASNATLTVDTSKNLSALRIYGEHALSVANNAGCQLTLTSASVETDVASASNAVTFTSVDVSEGKTLEIAYASDVSAVTGTGRVKLVSDGRNYTDLDLSKLGNSASTVELAGAIATTAGQTYLANVDCLIGALDLSGALTLDNGYSARTYSFGELVGEGALMHTGDQTFKLAFADASEFAGSLSTSGAQIGIGASPTYAAGTIAIAGKAMIATNKTWYAVNGIKVQAGGELSVACPRPDGQAVPVQKSALTVDVGGWLNLVDGGQGTDRPTEYVVSTGDLVINGGLKLNGKIVRKDAYIIGNGKITFSGAQTAGDSVSINVIGGNSGKSGKSIDDGNTAGVIPIAGALWNQGASKSDNTAVKVDMAGLREVLADGSVITGPMKATLVGSCTYIANGTTPANGDGELMYGYLDDGSTSYGGATIIVENIPYTQYDVYVYVGGDHSGTSGSFRPIAITVGSTTTSCPSSSNWGSVDSTHGTVTLTQNSNYVKLSNCKSSTLKVVGGTKSNSVRGGIAGIQIFNTGTRVNELTWKGVASGETWDKTRTNWSLSGGTSTAWYEDADALNIAVFTNDTALTLGEEVKPDVVNIASNTTANLRTGFVPKTSTILFSNVSLADVAAISGEMNGGYVTTKGIATTPYYYVNDGTMATVQLQVKEEEWLKSCKIVLTQDGADVKGYVVYAHYLQNGALGTSLENTSSTILNQDIAQSQADKGYGIQNLALHFERQSALTALNAQNFGKDFVVSNGILRVMADELAQDVTLVAGAKIDVISSVNTNVYVVTKGDVLVGGDVLGAPSGYILLNGSALDNESWTFANGTLTRIETGPRILDGGGEIAVNPTNATEYIVSTNNVKPKITIEGAGDHTIVVPPTVTNVVGVAPEKIKVRHGDRDITTAFKREGDATQGVALSLDPNGKVKVKGQGQGEEEISVTPELSTVAGDDHVAETPFVVSDEKAAVGVKSIPGLTYKLMRGTELGTYGHEAASERAETSRVTLKDSAKPADKAFYIIQVTP